jgi:hypothetical protein
VVVPERPDEKPQQHAGGCAGDNFRQVRCVAALTGLQRQTAELVAGAHPPLLSPEGRREESVKGLKALLDSLEFLQVRPIALEAGSASSSSSVDPSLCC